MFGARGIRFEYEGWRRGIRGRGGAGAWGYLWILRDCEADIGDLMVSSVNGSSPMTESRFCLRLSKESVLYSWMRIDRLAVMFSSFFVFGCRISELLGRVLFFSPSDSDVFEVKESLEAEFRSFEVYTLRFPDAFSAPLDLSLEDFDRPTAVAVEVVRFRPPNKGRNLFMGSSGE
jgi:hypothetical protein